jgi:hypothetical protein
MSAIPIVIPNVPIPRAVDGQPKPRDLLAGTRAYTARRSTAAVNWRLTDRGIAVVMVTAAVIMTVALVVIGWTAIRVTSAGYDPSLQESQQVSG